METVRGRLLAPTISNGISYFTRASNLSIVYVEKGFLEATLTKGI
jgi:hypothetical protein